jgi:hypothetical protein
MFIGLKKEYPGVEFFPYFVTHEGNIRTVREGLDEAAAKGTKAEAGYRTEVAESNLNEVFDQPYPWTWTASGKNRGFWTAEFGDVDVLIELKREGSWDMTFDRNGSMSVTGEGDQFKIFATVIDIAKDFVRQMQPERFSFYAHKDPDETTSSRPKLYSAMIKRFAGSLGYDSREKTSNDFVFYMLTRKKQGVTDALEEKRYTAKEWAIMSGGHSLEVPTEKPKLFDWNKY